jgi:hypothetical protein
VHLLRAFLIVFCVTAVAISVMLLVRRRAPEGSYFEDGDRASGVFGVLATGFAVLLGFIIFLAFESYDASRSGAEDEARLVAQQVETANLLREPIATDLTNQLVCFARSVVSTEWDEMEDGTLGDAVNPWGVQLYQTMQPFDPDGPREEAAYSNWLAQTSDREDARQDRIHGAVGVIPTPLWFVLFFIAGVIFVYMLFFADRNERAIVQATLMGAVISTIVWLLLLLQFLDSPFRPGTGALKPVAMERTLNILDHELRIKGQTTPPPCDASGRPA